MPTRSSASDRRRRGNVLILALAVGVTVALMLVALLSVTTAHGGTAEDRSQRAQARWAAEAGVAKALDALHRRRKAGFTSLLAGPDGVGGSPDDGILPGHLVSFGHGEVRLRFLNDDVDGDPYRDKNMRIVIFATGIAGSTQETVRVYATVDDVYRPRQSVVAGADLDVECADDDESIALANVHANGRLTLSGEEVVVHGNASATGAITVEDGAEVHGITTPFAAPEPVAEIDPEDFRDLATFVLRADGQVVDSEGDLVPGALAEYGWTFAAGVWRHDGTAAIDATFFAETEMRVLGSGSDASPSGIWTATFIALGDITISSAADLRTHTSAIHALAGQKLTISGSPSFGMATGDLPATPGLLYAVQEFDVEGETRVNGALVGTTATAKSLNPTLSNRIAGGAQVFFGGDVAVSTGKGERAHTLYWERDTTASQEP
jgi:hypothetical protein